MATLSYPFTITDTQWFDANVVMTNFNAVKNQLNGGLDQQNYKSTSTLTLTSIQVSNKTTVPSITPTGSLTLKLSSGECFAVHYGANDVFLVDEDGDITSGGFITMPVGTIVPFSGSWTNNSTIPGWYKCDGSNGTPNLVDKFIRMGTTSGATGGTNDAVVAQHTHTTSVTNNSATHTHTVSGTSVSGNYGWHTHGIPNYGSINYYMTWGKSAAPTEWFQSPSASDAHTHPLTTSSWGQDSADHTHTVSLANTGSATGTNMPSYYKVVYIMRIS